LYDKSPDARPDRGFDMGETVNRGGGWWPVQERKEVMNAETQHVP
jgi:hypothetical protein